MTRTQNAEQAAEQRLALRRAGFGSRNRERLAVVVDRHGSVSDVEHDVRMRRITGILQRVASMRYPGDAGVRTRLPGIRRAAADATTLQLLQ